MRRRIEFLDSEFVVDPVAAYAACPADYALLAVCDDEAALERIQTMTQEYFAALTQFEASVIRGVPLSVAEVVQLSRAHAAMIASESTPITDDPEPIEIIDENSYRTPISTPYGVHKTSDSPLNQENLPLVIGLRALTRVVRSHSR